MIYKNKKCAFSLTELLIVMVVLAVLFAALAPIITKRRNGTSITNEAVWNYVNDDEQQRDAYYDPAVPKWPSTAYIGLDANRVGNTSPIAKVVIKASKTLKGQDTHQRQIQFRYGSGDGVNAGSLFFDDCANLMLAGNNDSFVKKYTWSSYGNTIAGIGSFARIGSGSYNTAYGANVMKGRTEGSSIGTSAIYTAVGQKILYNSAYGSSRKNIFIGANSGQSEPDKTTANYLNNNVAVGANTMGSTGFYGARNILLGYMVGNGKDSNKKRVNDNIFIGSQYYTDSAGFKLPFASSSLAFGSKNNVILGYDTYVGGSPIIGNMVAVGHSACNSITGGLLGSRTCIGYKSGGSNGIVGKETPDTFSTDGYDHVFLGGVPLKGFNGRAVLEVHNHEINDRGSKMFQSPTVSPTVVLNSNLVVRGLLFSPSGGGELHHYRYKTISRELYPLSSRANCDFCVKLPWPLRGRWFQGCPTTEKGDAKSRSALERGDKCTSDLKSYAFSSGCPDLKVSDNRLKENITENNSGLDELISLIPYNYTFKTDKDAQPQTGVIAQDLQKIFPISVKEGKDGYLRIRWDEMFYAAINAIKALDKKLEKIAIDISGLEKDVKQLKYSHKQIQTKIVSLNNRAARLEKK